MARHIYVKEKSDVQYIKKSYNHLTKKKKKVVKFNEFRSTIISQTKFQQVMWLSKSK